MKTFSCPSFPLLFFLSCLTRFIFYSFSLSLPHSKSSLLSYFSVLLFFFLPSSRTLLCIFFLPCFFTLPQLSSLSSFLPSFTSYLFPILLIFFLLYLIISFFHLFLLFSSSFTPDSQFDSSLLVLLSVFPSKKDPLSPFFFFPPVALYAVSFSIAFSFIPIFPSLRLSFSHYLPDEGLHSLPSFLFLLRYFFSSFLPSFLSYTFLEWAAWKKRDGPPEEKPKARFSWHQALMSPPGNTWRPLRHAPNDLYFTPTFAFPLILSFLWTLHLPFLHSLYS